MREPQAQPQCAGDLVVSFRQIQTAIIDHVATQFMTIRQSARQKHPFGMSDAGKRRGQNRITDRRRSETWMAGPSEVGNQAARLAQAVNLIAGDAAAAMISGQVAGAELWDPYGGQVLAELAGSHEVSNSKDPALLKLALIADAIFVSDKFTAERNDAAVKTMKAMFAGAEYWRNNADEANEIIARRTGFSIEDVQGILGGKNNPEDGTMYMYNIREAARFCGAVAGEPPFGQSNGQLSDHFKLTNDWWVKFGLMEKKGPPWNLTKLQRQV